MPDQDESHTTWMFQYNPDEYRLEEAITHQLTQEWNIFWGRSLAQLGERVYFMRSGGDRSAITAVGRVVTPVREITDEPNRFQRYKVDVVYDYLLEPPLTRPEMRQHAELKSYRPFAEGERRTNFALPEDVARLTEQLTRPRLRRIEQMPKVGQPLIFISHSSLDNEFGRKLANDLRRALRGGPDTVWYDASGGLHAGHVFPAEIAKQIDMRPIFIVIMSPASMDSMWVRREFDTALAKTYARITPILYQPCDIWPDLRPIQYISFAPPNSYDQGLQELLGALGLDM